MASPQIIWDIVKNQNAFLTQSSNGVKLSKDVFNPSGKTTYTQSGFLHQHGVGVSAAERQVKNQKKTINQIDLHIRKRQRFQQKSKDLKKNGKNVDADFKSNSYSVTLPVRHGVHTASRVIRKVLASNPGLSKLTLRKIVAINRSQQRKRQLDKQEEKNKKK